MKTIISESVQLDLAEALCRRLLSESQNPVVQDLLPGTLSEFGLIVRETLAPTVAKAKADIDRAVKITSAKVKAWAMQHMQIARKLGRKTELFEKLINDPSVAAGKMASHMLGMQYGMPAQPKDIGLKDEVLDSIVL